MTHFETIADARTWYCNSGVLNYDHEGLPFDEDACVEYIWRHTAAAIEDRNEAALRAYTAYLVSIGADITDYDGLREYTEEITGGE